MPRLSPQPAGGALRLEDGMDREQLITWAERRRDWGHGITAQVAQAVLALAAERSVDVAWAEAEAVLRETKFGDDWEIGHLIREGNDQWAARAQEVIAGGTLDTVDAEGESPTAALRALTEKLRSHG